MFYIGFYSNQLSERGTEVAMYDYANYIETYFDCKCFIFYNNIENSVVEVINKFKRRFGESSVYRITYTEEIEEIIRNNQIKYFYNICSGKGDSAFLLNNAINLIHSVFENNPFGNFEKGDKYATISVLLSEKTNTPFIPHIVDLPIIKNNDSYNLRKSLNIPENALVLGRYGGYEQFDIEIAHEAIKQVVEKYTNIYFLFVNTKPFHTHKNIIYLDKIIEVYEKVKFINTCNAMIHARSDGEIFSLSIGEFSFLNKPILTTHATTTEKNYHLTMLDNKALYYSSVDELIKMITLLPFLSHLTSKDDDFWNMYKQYNPYNVMKKFGEVFLPGENMI